MANQDAVIVGEDVVTLWPITHIFWDRVIIRPYKLGVIAEMKIDN